MGVWSAEEIQRLKALYEECRNVEEISKELGRTPGAIRNKAYRLNITNPNEYTQEEIDYLIANYHSYNLVEVAAKLNRPKANVCRKARELGIERNQSKKNPKDKKQKIVHTAEELSAMHSEAMKKHWATHEHPRGMLGKKQSEKCRKASRERQIKFWSEITDKERASWAEKQVATRIKNNTLNPNLNSSNPYSRTRSGRRPDLGNIFFRSAWEANIARYFNYLNIEWQFEPKTFYFEGIKRGCVSYLPDFYLPQTNEWVEVKGWMDDKSKTKLKRFSKYYPQEKLILIDRKKYTEIEKQYKHRISGWE